MIVHVFPASSRRWKCPWRISTTSTWLFCTGVVSGTIQVTFSIAGSCWYIIRVIPNANADLLPAHININCLETNEKHSVSASFYVKGNCSTTYADHITHNFAIEIYSRFTHWIFPEHLTTSLLQITELAQYHSHVCTVNKKLQPAAG